MGVPRLRNKSYYNREVCLNLTLTYLQAEPPTISAVMITFQTTISRTADLYLPEDDLPLIQLGPR